MSAGCRTLLHFNEGLVWKSRKGDVVRGWGRLLTV